MFSHRVLVIVFQPPKELFTVYIATFFLFLLNPICIWGGGLKPIYIATVSRKFGERNVCYKTGMSGS